MVNKCPICNTQSKKHLKQTKDKIICLRCGYVHKKEDENK